MRHESQPYLIRAQGAFACWTPVGLRSERSSALVGSHAGWEGLLRGVLGKWSMCWRIHRVALLKTPRRMPVASNEMKFNSVGVNPVFVENQHTPRTTVFLRDVDYLITASICLSRRAGPDDSIGKFEDMFRRRISRGQQTKSIYFGIRECVAELDLVENVADVPPPVDINEDLGISFYATDWSDPKEPNYFYPLSIRHGVVEYPSWEAVRELGIARVMGRVA